MPKYILEHKFVKSLRGRRITLRLARDIADSIEKEMQYPGEIKVSVMRETRVIEYAR